MSTPEEIASIRESFDQVNMDQLSIFKITLLHVLVLVLAGRSRSSFETSR